MVNMARAGIKIKLSKLVNTNHTIAITRINITPEANRVPVV
jgi:hypothetical protein